MLTLIELAQLLASQMPAGADSTPIITGVSIDSRSVEPGNLFIALAGENFDGHDHLKEAEAKGAAAALVSQPASTNSMPCLLVKDTLIALAHLGHHWRQHFKPTVIAVTGSNGKTTTRHLLTQILETAAPGQVLYPERNFNNAIGVPLTLCRLTEQHRFAVLELGMSHAGEIAALTRLSDPDFAIITNAAAAHLHFFKSVADIAAAKGELFAELKQDGVGLINAEDAFAETWATLLAPRKALRFGFNTNTEIQASPVKGNGSFVLSTPKETIEITLQLLGQHNIKNALAASAVAYALNIPIKTIKTGLEKTRAFPGRLEPTTLPASKTTIINDTYNANPESACAAIDVLAETTGQRVFVLGDMGELGQTAPQLHAKVGEYAKKCGIDRLYTLGTLTQNAHQAFGKNAHHCTSVESLVNDLETICDATTTILIKGSRFMKMERVIEGLFEKESCYE